MMAEMTSVEMQGNNTSHPSATVTDLANGRTVSSQKVAATDQSDGSSSSSSSSTIQQPRSVHDSNMQQQHIHIHSPGIRSSLVNSSNFDVSSVGESTGMVQSQGMPSNGSTSLEGSLPTGVELQALIRQQLEYYFSKDNISSDKYLLSQMDGDHYVPISILASFNQVKRLTADSELLIKAIKESSVLQIDSTETKVRAIPEKRCTLILREIPKDTPKEDIHKLFSGETCPKFITCEFAENDCWYVTFSGEEDAQEAHRYLREEVREFRGNPIRARIKNMSAQRASTVPKPRPQYPYPMSMYNSQPVPFYSPQSPATVGWSFFDPRFAAQFTPNGYPPQTNFTGPQSGASGGGGGGGGVSGRSYSVSSTERGERRDGGINREGIRRGSTGGGGASKRYDGDKRTVGYSGGRYRRDEDRLRNLPNRFRNKRNEEAQSAGTTSSTERSENREGDPKRDGVKDRPGKQQRTPNRPAQKLDFAPGNFPPLPTSDTVVPPPPPPPPALPEEGNLADIVKGKKQDKGANGGGATTTAGVDNNNKPAVPVSSVAVPIAITTENKIQTSPQPVTSVATPITSMVTATTTSVPVTVTTPKNGKPSDLKSMSSAGAVSKDKNNNRPTGFRQADKDTKFVSQTRTTPLNTKVGNGNRPRHKDFKKQTVPGGGGGGGSSRPQKLSPGAVKRPVTLPPPSPVAKEDEKETEQLISSPNTATGKPEKLSYAQMAQQKPKPAQKQPKPPSSPPSADGMPPTSSSSSSPPSSSPPPVSSPTDPSS